MKTAKKSPMDILVCNQYKCRDKDNKGKFKESANKVLLKEDCKITRKMVDDASIAFARCGILYVVNDDKSEKNQEEREVFVKEQSVQADNEKSQIPEAFAQAVHKGAAPAKSDAVIEAEEREATAKADKAETDAKISEKQLEDLKKPAEKKPEEEEK